ncbi:MAG: sugar phosphate isomerase/epimerase [Candidatus Microthrix sp.]|jgi:sugar phosphate isomerase/epimerase|uniref:Sugar phosphate isomerase/epimerase n=1 Tax=Candidatus Neomicrothrix subdominans TaxID=2954438 RepID=A0A936NDG1_9ACTN|nr:sugar phosphate isomerase/epimerase [Candidatus Microthrix subdominans]MBP7595641.1 sugar phosphate isomerase/epimerase [Candidatus Microthrix sp.]MBP9067531.1 sugar phosphate isomerase/epimerase [Candidatus Microthrix sp.]
MRVIESGMCSITMRQLATDDVIALAVRAELAGIEWGADGHVPPGETSVAQAVARRCADAGVAVTSYGTYLGIGPFDDPDSPPDELAAALDSAEALGAPLLRVWTAFGIESDAPGVDRARVIETTAAIAQAADARGLGVALEFHPGTLTHTAAGAHSVLAAVDHPALRTHWQPDPALTPAEALDELKLVAGSLAYLHVFVWGPGGIGERYPLADGAELWQPVLAIAADAPPLPGDLPRYGLLEYVADDDPEQVVRDAATLNGWISRLHES